MYSLLDFMLGVEGYVTCIISISTDLAYIHFIYYHVNSVEADEVTAYCCHTMFEIWIHN